MTSSTAQQRLRALGLRLPPGEEEAMAVVLATLDAAAEQVRAPLPGSAEPAAVLVLKAPERATR